MTRFRRLALTSAIATLTLVAAGGLVRATGSGLGCLDEWPRCRGGWTVPPDLQGVIEYAHRALAALAIALSTAVAVAARRGAPDRATKRWAYAAPFAFVAQALLGALVVFRGLHAAIVTAHFLVAMFLVAATVRVWLASAMAGRPRATGDERALRGMAMGAAAGTFLVLLAGTYVREKGAGLAFGGWPLMDGRMIPGLGALPAAAHFVHRLLALVVFAHVLATAMRARSDARAWVRRPAWTLLALFVAQALAGAANVWTQLAPAAVLGHVALGAATWGTAVALVVGSRFGSADAPPLPAASGTNFSDRINAFVQLTKPRIIVLLLVTTIPTMVIAAHGMPSLWLVLATLVGGTLSAGGANAINQYYDRDIDEIMHRTARRPLPQHRVEPRHALVFGTALGVVAFIWLAFTVNVLTAAITTAGLLFYVFVYTVWMKRSTPQNIVIGGAAGAVPCLAGWAAVTGELALPAWVLFAIVFCWTPPHFWALAMKYREDYAAAGVPMLPVVATAGETSWQILLYSLLLVAETILLLPVARLGTIYFVAALVLGAGFLRWAVRLWRRPDTAVAMGLFKYSISYLALLFAAMMADRLVIG